MTQKTNIMTNEEYHKHDETNLLIAKFMGMETVVRHPRTGEWSQARFDFHHSWDSLMGVIGKMAEMDIDHEPLCSVSLYSTIEEVYKDVVGFIEWHNKNK